MKKTTLLCLLAALLPLHAEPVTLTVSAAISLKVPLETLKADFEKEHPGVGILFNFGSSGSLQQQIVNGAPVDVYISAAAKQMDDLEKSGLIVSESRNVVVENTVVLIGQAGSRTLAGFEGLASDDIKTIAIGEPKSVPAGMYAMEIFGHLGLVAAVRGKLVFAKDVRQVLTYVKSGNADAGIVYGSDVTGSTAVRPVAEAPPNSHTKVEYPAAIVRATAHATEAASFLDFLRSPRAAALFKTTGFATSSGP